MGWLPWKLLLVSQGDGRVAVSALSIAAPDEVADNKGEDHDANNDGSGDPCFA